MKSTTNAMEMDPMNPRRDYKMPWIMAQLGSGMAAALGWVITTAAVLLYTSRHRDDLEMAGFFSILTAGVVFIVWLTILMPIYRRIPPEARIWKWPFSTLSGAIAGELVMLAFSAWSNSGILLHHFSFEFFSYLLISPFAIWGMFLGGSIGLIAGLTHTFFRKLRKPLNLSKEDV
jgi:hypothetical protein